MVRGPVGAGVCDELGWQVPGSYGLRGMSAAVAEFVTRRVAGFSGRIGRGARAVETVLEAGLV